MISETVKEDYKKRFAEAKKALETNKEYLQKMIVENKQLIDFLERLESVTTDKKTADKIRKLLQEMKIW